MTCYVVPVWVHWLVVRDRGDLHMLSRRRQCVFVLKEVVAPGLALVAGVAVSALAVALAIAEAAETLANPRRTPGHITNK